MFSLDTPTAAGLKTEARALRAERSTAGTPITQSAALEEVARRHGYRDWNTAAAALPDRPLVPVQAGARVRGSYLGRPFTGMVLGVQLLSDLRHTTVTVNFDEPVDVSRGKLLGPIYRRRVTATLDAYGVSLARTSDGEPHMRIRRA